MEHLRCVVERITYQNEEKWLYSFKMRSEKL